ncbi:EamA-like transporter family protein [Vibrio diazotrophicus]|uniref:EamA-like transporter family protein n=1 Tax=Vibrio diazotrophicus TaxID=685 RepID=A0A329EE36_VIBDI|nr:DMT family transporter [Vibrio diazotrophicus]RAS69457.1 EamA-like transporter family protein [Vibrio diazotrophicus]
MSPVFLTVVTMFAFAANSILCRLALQDQTIDATTFTYLRLVSGAITLIVLHSVMVKKTERRYQPMFAINAGLALFTYALCFSIAYLELSTETGALLLFGTVQLSLLAAHFFQGNRINALELVGLVVSISGFVYLMAPSVTRPDILSALLMILSGLAWAVFTLVGRNSGNPISAISQGFWVAGLLCVLLTPWLVNLDSSSSKGIVLALISGSIASAAGYILWYRVISHLSMLQASVAQLSVPVIAIAGGTLLVGEAFTLHLTLVSALILGGIVLVIMGKQTK